jgi:hypothetical protein
LQKELRKKNARLVQLQKDFDEKQLQERLVQERQEHQEWWEATRKESDARLEEKWQMEDKKRELQETRRKEKCREERCVKKAEASEAFAFFKECVAQRRLIIPTGGDTESSIFRGWKTKTVQLLSTVVETAVDDYDMRKFFLTGQTLVQYWLATVTDYDTLDELKAKARSLGIYEPPGHQNHKKSWVRAINQRLSIDEAPNGKNNNNSSVLEADEHLVSSSFKEFHRASNSVIVSSRIFSVGTRVEVLLREFDIDTPTPDSAFCSGSVTGIDISTDGRVSYVVLLDDFELIQGIPETQMRPRRAGGTRKSGSGQLEVGGSKTQGARKAAKAHQLIDLVSGGERPDAVPEAVPVPPQPQT